MSVSPRPSRTLSARRSRPGWRRFWAGRGSPATRRAVRAGGRRPSLPPGRSYVPSWSSRSPPTTRARTVSATARHWCDYGPTRHRANVPASSCRRRRTRAFWSSACYGYRLQPSDLDERRVLEIVAGTQRSGAVLHRATHHFWPNGREIAEHRSLLPALPPPNSSKCGI